MVITTADLESVDSLITRLLLASRGVEEHQRQVEQLAAIRGDALLRLVSRGATHQELADLAGVTKARVGQLVADAKRRLRGQQKAGSRALPARLP